MKELLTKSFWQGVKKTFYKALKDPLPEDNASQAPAEGSSKPPSTSNAPPSSQRASRTDRRLLTPTSERETAGRVPVHQGIRITRPLTAFIALLFCHLGGARSLRENTC